MVPGLDLEGEDSVLLTSCVLTSLDLLLLILKLLFTFFTKQATLMRRSTVLSLPLKLKIPGLDLEGEVSVLLTYFVLTCMDHLLFIYKIFI